MKIKKKPNVLISPKTLNVLFIAFKAVKVEC